MHIINKTLIPLGVASCCMLAVAQTIPLIKWRVFVWNVSIPDVNGDTWTLRNGRYQCIKKTKIIKYMYNNDSNHHFQTGIFGSISIFDASILRNSSSFSIAYISGNFSFVESIIVWIK